MPKDSTMLGERVLEGGTHSSNGGSKIPPDKETERDTGQDIEMLPGEEDLNISTKEKSSPESQKTVTWKKSFIEVVQGREEHVAENRTIDPPPMVEGNYQVEIDRVVEKNTEKEWGHYLVGSFQGATFKKHILQLRLTGIWRTRAAFKVVPLDQGNYLFRFDDLEDRLGVLMGGPWFVGHHRLRLRLWDIDFDPEDDKISQVPIWIRLQNLPLKFWQNDIILKIAAAVGRPLKLDTFTATKQSGCFAQICVEVDLDKPLTRGVMLKSSTKSKWQSILYEDVPETCSFCTFAGHTIKMCKRKAEEMILTQQVEITGESQPQSTVMSAKEDENTWSVAVRTRRRSRRPIKEGGRKNATGNSFAGHGDEGGPLHQLRKETTDSGKPSHANPPSKENIVENGQFVHEKRPTIVKACSGMVDKSSKSRKDVGIVLSQGNKFDLLAVDEEILPNTILSLKEVYSSHDLQRTSPHDLQHTCNAPVHMTCNDFSNGLQRTCNDPDAGTGPATNCAHDLSTDFILGQSKRCSGPSVISTATHVTRLSHKKFLKNFNRPVAGTGPATRECPSNKESSHGHGQSHGHGNGQSNGHGQSHGHGQSNLGMGSHTGHMLLPLASEQGNNTLKMATQLGIPGKSLPQRLTPSSCSFPLEATATSPGYPIQMAPFEITLPAPTFSASSALISAPILDGNLVVDISPGQSVEQISDDSLGLVIYDPPASETVKAKAMGIEKMELCRLSGTKTKVDAQFEASVNSSDPVRQKNPPSKLAKTNF